MRRPCSIVLLCLAAALCAPPAASAHKVVTPDHKFGGLTAGDAIGWGWYTGLSLPADENPAFGHGEQCLRLGHKQRVLQAIGVLRVTCTVPEGTAISVIGITSFCDNVEPEPFFGADEAAQLKCARESLAPYVVSITLTVDGGPPTDLHKRRFETFSRQRSVQLLADNFLGVPAGPATFTVWGWMAWVTKLPPGRHELRSVAVFNDGSEAHIYDPTINVTRKRDDQ
jgi:hypothetical protein